MSESDKSFKTIIYSVLTAVSLAVAYNFIGIDSSGRKIRDDNVIPKGEISQTEAQIKLKELEIKEKELAFKMRELEVKNTKANNYSNDYVEYNLNGDWQGNNGFTYTFSQNGNMVSYSETNSLFGQKYTASSGTGILIGNKINFTGFGIYGQNFQAEAQVIGQNSITLSGVDLIGNPMQITLTRY